MWRNPSNFLFVVIAFYAAPAWAINTVTLMADNSLSIVLTELSRDYAKRTNTVVNNSFASSTAHLAQMDEGADTDLIITSNNGWIKRLKTQGLVDTKSETTIARNRIALVAPADSPLKISASERFPTAQLIKQFNWEKKFIVPSPDTLEEGVPAKEALRKLRVADDMEEYTLYVKQLGQMYDMIINQGMYGLFLHSNVIGKPDIRILELLPEDSHTPINYYVAIITRDNTSEARKFINYLKSDAAKKIFRNYGFLAD